MATDAVRAAVEGAVAGATAGAPFVGRAPFARTRFYEPVPTQMAAAPSLDAWALYATSRLPSGSPARLTDLFLRHLSVPGEAAAFGLANAREGYRAPACGLVHNPLSDDAGAMGRALYWGIVFAGNPERAAEWAFYDAGFDHAGAGRDACVVVARTMAAVREGDSVATVARLLVGALPSDSPLHRVVPTVLGSTKGPDGPREAAIALAQSLGPDRLQTAEYAIGAALLGLVSGEGDFGRTVCAAVGAGGAAVEAGMIAGALVATAQGQADPTWLQPLGPAFVAGPTFRELSPPATLDELVSLIAPLVARPVVVAAKEPDPPLEPGAEPAAAELAPSGIGALEEEPEPALATTPVRPAWTPPSDDANLVALGDVVATVRYLGSPVVASSVSSVSFTVALTAPDVRDVTVTGEAPESVELAFRSGAYRLGPEQAVVLPGVARLREGAEPGTGPTVRIDETSVRVVWPPAEVWAVVGPLPNIEGTGFDQALAPESDFSPGRVFAGRNGFPAKWEAVPFSGTFYDLEPRFMSGPGVLYMRAAFRLPAGGSHRLVVAASTGLVAWIDGQRCLRYHDQHTPVARPVAPYVAEFDSTGETVVMLKVLRNLVPLEPLVLYVLAEDGSVVRPRVRVAP